MGLYLLPTRARDQRLKCANNSNVAHFLILSSKSSRHDMTQQILKNSWWRNVWFCVATLCNFPTVAVETATNVAWAFPRDHIGVVGTVVT